MPGWLSYLYPLTGPDQSANRYVVRFVGQFWRCPYLLDNLPNTIKWARYLERPAKTSNAAVIYHIVYYDSFTQVSVKFN